jgi:hypothetical protein
MRRAVAGVFLMFLLLGSGSGWSQTQQPPASTGGVVPAATGYVRSGCLPAVPAASLTLAAFGCEGQVLVNGILRPIVQAAVPVGPLPATAGAYWLALHTDTAAVVGWTRQAGTHYLWTPAATRPADPAGGLVIARVTVAGSLITAVQDFRRPASFARAGVYDLTDPLYGATGNGATDDTTAVQAVLDAGDAGWIICPPGNYKITSTLTVRKGVRFVGLGAGPGGVGTTDPLWRGCALEHHFTGTFLNIVGVAAQVQASVGHVFENVILRQMFGTGSGAAGIAINITATSSAHNPTWVKLIDVNLEYDVGNVDDWTYCVVMDGNATTSTAAGGARDHALLRGRYYGGTQSSGCIVIRAGANIHLTDVLVNGVNGHVEITGADAAHASSNTSLVGLAINGNLLLDYAAGTTCAGCQVASLATTAHTALTTYQGAVAAGGVSLVGPNEYTSVLTNHQSYLWSGAQQEFHLSSPTGQGTILGLGQDGIDRWRFIVAGASGAFVFTGPGSLAVYDINNSGGLTYRGAIGMNVNALTYGPTVAINAALGNEYRLSVTNGNAFTMANATNALIGQRLAVTIVNNHSSALGAVTWGSNYKLAGPWVSPAPGFNRTITFRVDTATEWHEMSRTVADVPD